ncbi:MAG: right-handed parallel beta-helix repeat-containing protein [Alphaproteobacteria bacterium]|nr:right-handed parallel beta-helix repeat-containing protein [Alphaproteobacteria bacterium]MBU1837953.1 right-handed parallel beta-helix repeat-containing protein [Alphaproteobacteria bacterium]
MQSCLIRCLMGILLAVSTATMAPAQNAQQATPQTLQAVITASTGGVIALAPGHYGSLSLRNLQAPASAPRVIASADPAQPARFSGLALKGVSHLTLQDVVFDYTFQPGDAAHLRPFAIADSQGITISRSTFNGDNARGTGTAGDGFGTAYGLRVDRSADITVQNSQIFGFLRGMVVNDSQNVTVQDNDIYAMRSDGLNFAQVTDAAILRNQIHDFRTADGTGDHADMIQFWTNGTSAPTRNVTIADNVLNAGAGRYTQSIFMRNDLVDRGLAGPEMFYRNITITGNVIINAHRHGITVGETDGLRIANNTVVQNAGAAGQTPGKPVWIPRITVAPGSHNVTITSNVTSAVTGPAAQPDWTVTANLLVQNTARMQVGFYGQVFVPGVLQDTSRIQSFAPRPGGMLDGTGLGSPLLQTLR